MSHTSYSDTGSCLIFVTTGDKKPPSGGSFSSLRLLGHCSNFCCEVSLNFLDAFAHFEADEASYVSVVLFQQLSNGFAPDHNERLASQRNFAGEFLHAAFNHFLCDFFWLTRLHRDVQLNTVLFLYHFSRHVFWFNEFWFACSDVHCQLFNQLFVSAFSRNQNTDTRTVLVRTQNVAFGESYATDVDVLTDFSDQRNTFFELCFQNFNVSDFASNSCVQNFVSKCTETTIFSNEVSLAVNFQNDAVVPSILVMITPSAATLPAFSCFDRAPDLRMFSIASSMSPFASVSAFAIHHACASTLAQLFTEGCGNFSHS